jgi:hypothetical protein
MELSAADQHETLKIDFCFVKQIIFFKFEKQYNLTYLFKNYPTMKILFIALFLCSFILADGQFVEPKFGKVEISDLSMTKYDKDTTAGALMLFDNGSSEFILNRDANFQFVYNRHFQIKIFKKSEFVLANITIRLFKGKSGKEDIMGLKAVTYNLIDGKTVKTKLDNDNIFKSEGKNYTDLKFAFPEIKEGCVIELAYSITSDFLYNFRGWNFQYSYPARWSQYSYIIPEYFQYREASKGYLQFDVQKKNKGSVTFEIPTANNGESGGMVLQQAGASNLIKTNSINDVLGIKDVPAFISEPDIDCESNYIQSIEFELNSIELPGKIRNDYTQTWESVNAQMKKDDDFGMLLKTGGFVQDTVTTLIKNKSPEIDKAISIYNYLQKRMKWNGENRMFAPRGLKKPFTDGVGSSAEINLLLTLMLQTAGLKANPVMFSTRNNGIAVTYYPTITKFNSVLTSVEIGGKVILLDAVSKYCPFGVLPSNDINGKGRVVNDLSGDWVNLDATEKYRENRNYALKISPEGILTGSITDNYAGYAGIFYRNSLSSEKSSDDFYRKMQENSKGLTINKYSIANRYDNSQPVSDTLNVEITDNIELIGDKILFHPVLFETVEKNRYTLEERKYPVDYNYPISDIYTFNYTIPEGYKVESLPQPIRLSLPDNSISITYSVQSTDNKIKIEYKRDVNKILFLPKEYAALKNLYDQLVKKHSEEVILKKSI